MMLVVLVLVEHKQHVMWQWNHNAALVMINIVDGGDGNFGKA